MSALEGEVLQAFVSWLKTATPGADVQTLLGRYRESLLKAGVPSPEAAERLRLVMIGMSTNREVWPLLFNAIYASDTPAFRTTPSALLEAETRDLPPGTALDVCIGEGRNAAFLAAKGWAVTGIDVSETGLQRVQKRAANLGTAIETLLEDCHTFDYSLERWNLILFFYTPAPLTDSTYIGRLTHALKPGGLLLIESFAGSSADPDRRPVDLDPTALRTALAPLELRRFEETRGQPEWPAPTDRTVRVVAAKPERGNERASKTKG